MEYDVVGDNQPLLAAAIPRDRCIDEDLAGVRHDVHLILCGLHKEVLALRCCKGVRFRRNNVVVVLILILIQILLLLIFLILVNLIFGSPCNGSGSGRSTIRFLASSLDDKVDSMAVFEDLGKVFWMPTLLPQNVDDPAVLANDLSALSSLWLRHGIDSPYTPTVLLGLLSALLPIGMASQFVENGAVIEADG